MVILLAIRLVVLISVLAAYPDFPSATANRYAQIAASDGRPYRDFDVEYAPGELLIAEAVGWSTPGLAVALLALLAFAGDLSTFIALRRGWGDPVARRYLWLGLPLLILMYRRADIVTVAFAVAGLTFARVGHDIRGGASLAIGTLTRLWPGVLAGIWVIERRRRPLWVFAATVLGGVTAWVALGGVDAIRQVSSFRGATGWELESTVGVVVWALTGEHRFESRAFRTGLVPGWAGVVMLASLLVIVTAIWWRASTRESDVAGRPALAAVATLLVLSPLLSPHFVIWLLPWIAIAGGERRRWTILGAIPVVLTGVLVTSWYLHSGIGAGPDQVIIFTRNCALIAIVVAYFVDPGDRRRQNAG